MPGCRSNVRGGIEHTVTIEKVTMFCLLSILPLTCWGRGAKASQAWTSLRWRSIAAAPGKTPAKRGLAWAFACNRNHSMNHGFILGRCILTGGSGPKTRYVYNGIDVRLSKDSSVRDPMMGVNSCLPGACGTCGESVLAFFRNVPQQTPRNKGSHLPHTPGLNRQRTRTTRRELHVFPSNTVQDKRRHLAHDLQAPVAARDTARPGDASHTSERLRSRLHSLLYGYVNRGSKHSAT